jgi:hypothetical protein
MPTILQNMRDTNHRLSFWLNSMGAEHGRPILATPEHMAAFLSELLRAGEELRAEPTSATGSDPELAGELAQYRRHVERLRELLPSIHDQLLAERARLEAHRAQVRAADEWAGAFHQTL